MKYLLNSVFVFSLFIAGCQSDFGVNKTGMESWIQSREKTALSTDELSRNGIDFLLREGLYEDYKSNPEKSLKLLSTELVDTKERQLLSVLIELTYLQAKKCDDEDKAAYYYLSSCIYSYAYLFGENFENPPSPFEPEFIFACRFYNYSSAEIFEYLQKKGLLISGNINMPFLNGKVKFLPPKNNLPRKLTEFSDFEVCFDYQSHGFHSLTRQSGLGVPLISTNVVEYQKKYKNQIYDISQIAFPATMFIKFDSPEKNKFSAVMEYYDPLKTSEISVNEKNVPLEMDISTYLGWLLRKGESYNTIKAMMDTSIMDRFKGLYMIAPYDKDKIPVVFSHGILSQPRTWVQTINTLLKDSKIRENYQFWLFAYPSGNPVLYSAYSLRRDLLQAQKQFDPEGKNPKFNNMVLVNHSMGGLVAKTTVQNTEDKLLRELIGDKSLDDYDLSDEQKDFLKEMVVFSRLPFVNRVVFISVPHRGSEMTRWWVARVAASFINLPGNLKGKVYEIQNKIKLKRALENDDLNIEISTGADNLDPDNKALIALMKIPIDSNVKYHSIIGNNEKAGVPGGTDGIVPYSSAHLDGAESELIVKSGHSAHEKALAIKEIKRILLEHLKEKDTK